MIEFLSNYGLFTLKLVTVLVALAALGAFVSALVAQHQDHAADGHLEVTKLNDRMDADRRALRAALLDPQLLRLEAKQKRRRDKAEQKAKKREYQRALKQPVADADQAETKQTVYVLDFRGDLQASGVSTLRREITAVLAAARPSDEVVLRLESGGGLVHSYGLCASQLRRIVDADLKLTICVDKIAASGGYMMACVGHHLIAAPFAVIGSIGVVAQLPNFHRLLQKHDIDFEMVTAGKHKRTLTVFGKNTPEGRRKFEEEIEETHGLFKEFVRAQRPSVDVDQVGTGEIWFGTQAIERQLVDEVLTSDQYLRQACDRADVFEVRFQPKRRLQDRIATSLEQGVERVITRLWEKGTRSIPSA